MLARVVLVCFLSVLAGSVGANYASIGADADADVEVEGDKDGNEDATEQDDESLLEEEMYEDEGENEIKNHEDFEDEKEDSDEDDGEGDEDEGDDEDGPDALFEEEGEDEDEEVNEEEDDEEDAAASEDGADEEELGNAQEQDDAEADNDDDGLEEKHEQTVDVQDTGEVIEAPFTEPAETLQSNAFTRPAQGLTKAATSEPFNLNVRFDLSLNPPVLSAKNNVGYVKDIEHLILHLRCKCTCDTSYTINVDTWLVLVFADEANVNRMTDCLSEIPGRAGQNPCFASDQDFAQTNPPAKARCKAKSKPILGENIDTILGPAAEAFIKDKPWTDTVYYYALRSK